MADNTAYRGFQEHGACHLLTAWILALIATVLVIITLSHSPGALSSAPFPCDGLAEQPKDKTEIQIDPSLEKDAGSKRATRPSCKQV